jgi:hypothetical protein
LDLFQFFDLTLRTPTVGLGWIVFAGDIHIEDLLRIFCIFSPNEQLYARTERQTVAIVVAATVVTPDHRLDSSRFQYALCETGIEIAVKGANDDQFRLCFKMMCVKATSYDWRIDDVEMIHEFHTAVRAPDEPDTIFRFALRTEHRYLAFGD